MSTSDVVELLCMGLGLGGLLFFLVAGLIAWSNKKKAARCTASVAGKVFGFQLRDNGVSFPRVAFEVKGKEYESKLRYKNTIVTSTSFQKEAVVVGDVLAPTLRIKKNSHFSGDVVQEALPKGTVLTVFYNPTNPSENYVERHVGSIMPLIFSIVGTLLTVLATVLYIVL